MEDEKKIETPEEKVETAVPLEKEDIYGNDEFVDAKKPEPVVEEKTEPEPEPEPEEEPEPQPEDEIKDAATYQYSDPRLKNIEDARILWHHEYKKWNTGKIAISIGTLIAIVVGYIIPYFVIQDEKEKSKWTLIVAAICAGVGIAGIAIYGIFQRKKNRAQISAYFNSYYSNVNDYVFDGLPVENVHGDIDAKIDASEVEACGLYPGAKHIGSRDNITFTYQGVECSLCDMAAQKDTAKALQTVFVGKYLRSTNSLPLSKGGLVIYFRGNKRALPPLVLPELNQLSKNKQYAIYGAKENRRFITPELESLLKQIHTSKLLVDVAISIQPGKTYMALGYEDTLMVLPNDKPFNPGYVEAYKPQMKLFLEIAECISKIDRD